MPLLFGPLGTAPEGFAERYGALQRGRSAPLDAGAGDLVAAPSLAAEIKNGMLVDIGRSSSPIAVGATALSRFIGGVSGNGRQVGGRRSSLRYPNGFAMRIAAEGRENKQ